MSRAAITSVGVFCAGLFVAAAPARSFQELPEAPPPEVSYSAAESVPAHPQQSLNAAPAANASASKDAGRMGWGLFPKLDIGLELLYGERPETATESLTVQEGGDVSVLGKVKRRF
jgi:hypothetical protein